jgi:DNA-binding GntR family transcriptional regulator
MTTKRIGSALTPINVEVRLLKERAYQVLRYAIISLDLRPGEPLTERSLSARLGVSKSPIRDALIQLEQERFVRSTPFKGFEVPPLTADYLRTNFQFGEALELYAVEHFILSVEDGPWTALKRNHDEVRDCLAQGDPERAYRTNRFHQILPYTIDNPIFLAARRVIEGPLRRIQNIAIMISGRMAKTYHEHQAIFDAIDRRASELAARGASASHFHAPHPCVGAHEGRSDGVFDQDRTRSAFDDRGSP